jgi:3-hydroxyisobutyrate dehydrogenase-like beta-hydroxyacid dehydrogenase
MAIRTVAIMSPGDMGHAVGRVVRLSGRRVITCLAGRSPRTAELAAAAEIEAVPDLETLVREADVLLSILVPANARALAREVAQAVTATDAEILYVDCNAIAPATVLEIGDILAASGASFADGGIIGFPPRPDGAGTRLYVSGPEAGELLELSQPDLEVRLVGPDLGQASGLKMCYASLTKGLAALGTEMLVAGRALGLQDQLRKELEESQGQLFEMLKRFLPTMPPKAGRWVGEMEEIAATYAAVGLTPKILEGAADMYRLVSATELGAETPERRSRGQTIEDLAEILAEALTARASKR